MRRIPRHLPFLRLVIMGSFLLLFSRAFAIYEPRHEKTGVCDQGRLKSACVATEAGSRLGISDIESRGIIQSSQRTTKALIRLRRCAG